MIAIACDHAALELKAEVIKMLDERGLEYKDFGTYTTDSCHYPIFGARAAKDLYRRDAYEALGRVEYTTEDGSLGEKGYVTNHSVLTEKFDGIFTCGPKPMMLAVAKYARENGIACEVSLENKMACGLGACLCCVEDTKEGHKCVCTDGPVFSIDELKW